MNLLTLVKILLQLLCKKINSSRYFPKFHENCHIFQKWLCHLLTSHFWKTLNFTVHRKKSFGCKMSYRGVWAVLFFYVIFLEVVVTITFLNVKVVASITFNMKMKIYCCCIYHFQYELNIDHKNIVVVYYTFLVLYSYWK